MTNRLTTMDPSDCRAVRRSVHAEPELGFCEIITADLIWRSLQKIGWNVEEPIRSLGPVARRLVGDKALDAAEERARDRGVPEESIRRFGGGHTGFVAELAGTRPGPRIGIRIDLDALPVAEANTPSHRAAAAGFASREPGVMHACGHDAHVALGLRLAAALASDPDFPGSVRMIFQPAEEGVRGAAPMVAAGACDDVDVLLGLHVGFGVALGEVAAAVGLLGTTKYRIDFAGKAAHAARAPEKGRNALLAAADTTMRLHDLVSVDDQRERVNVGVFHAEGASNIVSAAATIRAEVRAVDDNLHRDLEDSVRRILGDVEQRYGVETTVSEIGRADTTFNDEEIVSALEAAATKNGLPFIGAHELGASDDASVMMNRCREQGGHAMYMIFGSGEYGAHHSSTFDLDERILEPAAAVVESMIRSGMLRQLRAPAQRVSHG